MAITYQELLTQAVAELADREQRSIPPGFPEQLMELCVCIISIGHSPLRETTTMVFPSSVPLDAFDYLPIIDMFVYLNMPNMLMPVAIRDAEGKQLDILTPLSLDYFFESFALAASSQREYYRILSNLLGVRPTPPVDTPLELIYIPYIEVHSLSEALALDDSYIPHMLFLLKCFLSLRDGNGEQAEREWKSYVSQR